MKSNPYVDLGCYNTYYYANVVHNVLSDQFAFLRHIHDFFENDAHLVYAQPFQKQSLMHRFIEFSIESLFDEDLHSKMACDSIRTGTVELPINSTYRYYGIKHTTFAEWLSDNKRHSEHIIEDQMANYYSDLRLEESYEKLMTQLVAEVFHLLFGNRRALLLLNDMAAFHIRDTSKDDIDAEYSLLFEKNGVLKRVYVPSWAKNAVFFRDRGRCVFCNCDLTGLMSQLTDKHFDHIVALDNGGLNDVTNLQLTCEPCNLKKSWGQAMTSDRYETWYDMTEQSN